MTEVESAAKAAALWHHRSTGNNNAETVDRLICHIVQDSCLFVWRTGSIGETPDAGIPARGIRSFPLEVFDWQRKELVA